MAEIEEYNFFKAYMPEDYFDKLYGEDLKLKFTKGIKRNWKNYGYGIAILAAIAGFILGYIGYFKEYMGQSDLQSPLNIIFMVIRLYFLQNNVEPPNPWELEFAKYVCPIAFSYSIILAIIVFFQENFRFFRLQLFKNHIVICGLNKWTSQLISDLAIKGKHIIVIEKQIDNEYKLKLKETGAILLNGDCSDSYMLNKAKIFRAKYLVVFTTDDSKNMETAINTKKMMENVKRKNKRGKTLKCYIHITDEHLYNAFKRHDIFQEKTKNLEMNIFNNYTNDARVLFLSSSFDTEIDTKEKGNIVHLLIVGFGYLGESVLLQAARMGHYANEEGIKITIMEENAEELKEHFFYHYPEIMNIKVCEKSFDINFVNSSFKNMKNVENQIKSINDEQPITAIIICLEEETKAIKFGVDLISMLEFERIPIKLHFPIRVYLDENEDVFKLPKTYPVSPFGLIRSTCSQEVVIRDMLDELAKSIHEDYKLKQEQKGLTKKDNPYLVEWDELPPDIKDSNRQQADHIPIKLRALNLKIIKKEKKGKIFEGFTEAEITTLARMEHNRWCAERWISGWKYADIEGKDVKKKLHALLKPFDEIKKEEEKQKDFEFIRNIPNLLKQLNLQLIRGN